MKRSMQRLSSAARHRREQGVALLTALILMLAVLMTGIASTRSALQNARAAAHERDRLLAVQMADAALSDAERDIEGGTSPGSARATAFASGRADAFANGCGGGTPYNGLCTYAPDPERHAAILAEDEGPAVVFGTFTGRLMPHGGGLPVEAPRYLIELMPLNGDVHLYRITTRGAGAMPHTYAALQAYYSKPLDGSAGRRVGWRELGNWSELYAAN
jgi:type IV pilus assembly protein PilX